MPARKRLFNTVSLDTAKDYVEDTASPYADHVGLPAKQCERLPLIPQALVITACQQGRDSTTSAIK